MFGLFSKRSEKEKLQLRHKRLLEEAHKFSTTNRKISDEKIFEAEKVMVLIEKL